MISLKRQARCGCVLLLAACSDGATPTAPVSGPVDEPLLARSAIEVTGAKIRFFDGAGAVKHVNRFTKPLTETPGTPPTELERGELLARIDALPGRGGAHGRVARTLLVGTAAEREMALRPYLAGASIHHAILGRSISGAVKRRGASVLDWELDAWPQETADRVMASSAPARAGNRDGEGWRPELRREICETCLDYDPDFNPDPVVWEMAGVYSFVSSLESDPDLAQIPDECRGEAAAFSLSVGYTVANTAWAVGAAFMRMPNLAYTYASKAAASAGASYVAYEFLKGCIAQHRRR